MRRWAVAAIVVAGFGVAAVATAAPTSIIGSATADRPARRLAPPGPHVGGCAVFPSTNAWNQEIASLPLHPLSAEIIGHIQSIGTHFLHPDFGENQAFGIPFLVVPATQPLVPISYDLYGDESDPGPFPIPLDAPVEAGSDGHVLVLQEQTCQLYELYVGRQLGTGWVANSGAHFDLFSNALRTLGWTSADAAGLPILPGLVRYDEVAAGLIDHAIRVTFSQTQSGFILPATHFASSRSDPTLPAMGMRLRLGADFDVTGLTGQARVIATAMQRYGVIVADNGSNWFFQGAPSPGWNDDDLNQLKTIPGTAFEVVDTGAVRTG
ncbi:MAG: hypothetical protein M3P52_11870 [Actinomycetota bacterium]|nr:hypothetical protein [Actinomycetota bacterium]